MHPLMLPESCQQIPHLSFPDMPIWQEQGRHHVQPGQVQLHQLPSQLHDALHALGGVRVQPACSTPCMQAKQQAVDREPALRRCGHWAALAPRPCPCPRTSQGRVAAISWAPGRLLNPSCPPDDPAMQLDAWVTATFPCLLPSRGKKGEGWGGAVSAQRQQPPACCSLASALAYSSLKAGRLMDMYQRMRASVHTWQASGSCLEAARWLPRALEHCVCT
ncbi:hypothetical protein HaLaN_01940 [Haematococcus lacustris]|uniref:Uncharacterized protein n=1 Tax=Haematococcus lacustris TaxID=44745 RepID=A0A699YM95_HAELA|nr:hypothetical protein HaLaN_01940 [Haematococcus lacustris]